MDRAPAADEDNSFEEDHRVRCFNHTMQLLVKCLLRPFLGEKLLAKQKKQMRDMQEVVYDDDDAASSSNDDEAENPASTKFGARLTDAEWESLQDKTKEVKDTLKKVRLI